ncbi:MAG: chemotaxis protein [Desulfovibrionaceae bacterium]
MSQNTILLEAGTNELELVEFYIDEFHPETGQPYRGHYGINVAKVLEILRPPHVAPLPDRPHECVLGAFELRQSIIPLVDLSMLMGMHSNHPADCRVIISEFNNVRTGFLVSGVTRIHRISWQEIEQPGEQLAHFSSDNITGVVRLQDHLLLVLDMEKLVADLSPATAMRVQEQELDALSSSHHQYRALVADDSESIRKLMHTVLTRAGFDVMVTHNGQEAWETLQAAKTQASADGQSILDWYDVVVSDIEMPAMDGHTLCKKIKEDPFLRALPVMLFSSLITDALQHKGDSVGADGQIAKPEINALAEMAVNLIESNPHRSA